MSIDILDFLLEATKESNSFENHPGKNFAAEEKLLYLQALTMVMYGDGEIHENEKEYIRILIKSFGMDESSLEGFVTFSQNPDKDTIQAFFKKFKRRPIAQLFIYDAFMMSRRDNIIHDRETAIIAHMANQLEISAGTQKDIYDLFCFIKNKNWQESAMYFSSHLLNPEYFKHVLDYHDVDFDELMIATKNIRSERLIEVVRNKYKLVLEKMQWEPLVYVDQSNLNDEFFKTFKKNKNSESIEITSAFLPKNILHDDVLIPFIQSMLDRGELRVSGDDVLKKLADKEVHYFKMTDLGLMYQQEDCFFYRNSNDAASAGYTPPTAVINDFCSILFNSKIDLSVAANINKVTMELFGCSFAYGKRKDFLAAFPKAGSVYLTNEIVLSYNGHFVMNINTRDACDTDSNAKVKLNCLEVLESGCFRLLR